MPRSLFNLLLWGLYYFPGGTITNYHKLGCSKQQKCVLLQFWGQKFNISFTRPKSRCGQESAPSGGSRGNFSPCPFRILVAANIFLHLWMPPSNLFSYLCITCSSLCWIISSCFFFYKDIVMAYRPHWDNPG